MGRATGVGLEVAGAGAGGAGRAGGVYVFGGGTCESCQGAKNDGYAHDAKVNGRSMRLTLLSYQRHSNRISI